MRGVASAKNQQSRQQQAHERMLRRLKTFSMRRRVCHSSTLGRDIQAAPTCAQNDALCAQKNVCQSKSRGAGQSGKLLQQKGLGMVGVVGIEPTTSPV